jgi:succinate dehydrogenase/fumarate reductase flavoprotein subunit
MADPRRVIVVWLIGLVGIAGGAFAAQAPEDAAQAAAESWLALVDGGDYPGSWDRAARVLKAGVRQTEWAETMGGVRSPAGRLVSRKLKSREYTEKAPTTRMVGGKVYTWGDGKYVVLHYETAFANKPSATETVIAMADPDGVWRVSGYSVR